MSARVPCGACQMGDHDNHDGTWHGTPGVIGGHQCGCSGDCTPPDLSAMFLLPAEGPATVTPECCEVCDDAALGIPVPCDPDGEPIHGDREGPATVTLIDDEREALTSGFYDSPIGQYGWQGREECVAFAAAVVPAVESIVAARVAALTADLATARAEAERWRRVAVTWDATRPLAEAEQVIANVRALVDEWPTGDMAVTQCANAIRALLPAAPTGEGE